MAGNIEYIEKEDAKRCVCKVCVWKNTTLCDTCVHPIDGIPTVDLYPLGKWKTVMCDDGYGEYTLFECDQCGSQSAQKRNYCSNCGAKME